MCKFFISLLILSLLYSCKEQDNQENIIVFDEALIQNQKMSEYFESIEYIQLETGPDCFVGASPNVYVLNDYILVTSQNCLLFERKTGKFIRQVGRKGNGPNEYSRIPGGIFVNEESPSVYLHGGKNLLEYSLSDSTALPQSSYSPGGIAAFGKIVYIANNLWAVGILDPDGKAANQLLFFDRKDVIDSIPNPHKFTMREDAFDINFMEHLFYCYDNNVYYKNLYNNTIFKIVDRKLQPAWILDIGNFQPHYLLKENPSVIHNKFPDYYIVNSIIETDKCLFISLRYDRKDKDYVYNKKTRNIVSLTSIDQKGFINDIDGGVSFWPNSSSQSQELVKILLPDNIKEHMNNKSANIETIKDKKGHGKLKEMSAGLSENDNPVIMIAKLK